MGTVLKMLLDERHLASHKDFCDAYRRHAAELGSAGWGEPPSRAQFYNWLAGEVKGLPQNHHRRVLALMFPGWSIPALFPAADALSPEPKPGAGAQAGPEEFLGAEMAARGVTLVVPTFELSTRSVDVLGRAGIPRQHIFSKHASVFSTAHRIDVPTAMAENDVRGMLYVMSMIQQHDGISVSIHSDREVVVACDRPYISFGLSSNDCTHLYLESSDEPLFAICDSPPAAGAYLEHLELVDGNHYSSDDHRNIGIIARVRPAPDLHPGRYWFFCAGLGARGTTGASWYLAKHWQTLQERATDREFVAVIGVRTFSDQTATLEHLLTR